MKREDIKNLLPDISKENLDAIMDLHSADVGAHKQNVTALTTERDQLKTQLAEANKQIGGIETVILYTRPEYAHISSTLVRDLYAYGKDVSDFVPNTLR